MDLEQHGDNMAGNNGVAGQVHWSNAMSAFVLKFLADLVASGTKTSTGFKQVHLNSCARALYENFGVQRTGTQIANHLRKWKRIYAKVEKLKNLSAANWDEHNCIISLSAEHYKNHIQDHREDANYLNIPIEHYHEMATIFGNSLATDAYAKGSNDPLATEVTETDNAPKATYTEVSEQFGYEIGTQSGNNGAESSGTKPPPSKKHKIATDDDLVVMISQSLGELSSSIKKLAEPDLAVPTGLYAELKSIPGFHDAHLDHYYAYLCDNPPLARAFYALPDLSSIMIWVARYIKNHQSELM